MTCLRIIEFEGATSDRSSAEDVLRPLCAWGGGENGDMTKIHKRSSAVTDTSTRFLSIDALINPPLGMGYRDGRPDVGGVRRNCSGRGCGILYT